MFRDTNTYKRLETPISSALDAEVTAILFIGASMSNTSRELCRKTNKTTSRTAMAPPFPIITAAAAGAARPALVWAGERGFGYVGKLGYGGGFIILTDSA